MVEMERRKKSGMLLLIDFEKAFDSISWEYIEEVLNVYNFGPDYKKWFKVIYQDAKYSNKQWAFHRIL